LTYFDDRVVTTRPFLGSRQYLWLTLAFLGVVVYGSLVPLRFRFIPWQETLTRFSVAFSAPVRFDSPSDWLSNVLLFIPLSFLMMGTLSVDRAPKSGWMAALAVVPCCALLSTCIEFAQLYFPPRVTSLNDVVAETIGGLLGSTLWLLRGQRITAVLRQFWTGLGDQSSTRSLLAAYLIFLVVLAALPMDLTIRPVEIYRKFRDGRIDLIPFSKLLADPFGVIEKGLKNVAYFLPVGVLLAGLEVSRLHPRRSWLAIIGVAVGLPTVVSLIKLMVFTNSFDSSNVVTGSLAIVAGWRFVLRFRQPQVTAAALRINERREPPRNTGRAWAWGLLVFWLAALVFFEWQPFNFDFSTEMASRRLHDLSLVPFADYQQADYIHTFDQVCTKVVLFIPAGVLLATLRSRSRRFDPGLWVIALAVMMTTLLEAGQFFLPTRFASISDVIVESFGVWFGFLIGRRSLLLPSSARPGLSGSVRQFA
jgi:glycopeptide antibiotics resistance protein